jgi:hypothetical protein
MKSKKMNPPFDIEDGYVAEGSILASDIPSDPRLLNAAFGPDADHPLAQMYDRHDPWFALKAMCCCVWIPIWAMQNYLLVRIVLFPFWLLYLLAGTVIGACGAAVLSIENAIFPDPRKSFDRDRAEALGGIVDADGNIVGRTRPMRPSTLLLRFIKLTAAWFILLNFTWGVWLATLFIFSTEKYTISEVLRHSYVVVK